MKYGLKQIKQRAIETLGFLALIWFVFLLDRVLPLERYGLRPRTESGIWGIFTMPFLHRDWAHIVNNTWPLLILMNILANTTRNFWHVIVSLVFGSGMLLWLFGRTAMHIGASALVFGLIGYLLVAGIKARQVIPFMGTIIVFILYSGIIFSGISPMQAHVSWDGHLFGLIAGIGLGFVRRSKRV